MQRFWDKVDQRVEGCWEWLAYKHRQGYGMIRLNKKLHYAHRVAWELAHGLIPEEKCVLHKCDNPSCVNPDHLFLGSQLDNIKDRNDKNRQAKGESGGNSKLDSGLVAQIRKLSGNYTQQEIIDTLNLGVHNSQVSRVLNHKTWKG